MAIFGEQAGGLFAIGPYRGLAGRPLDELAIDVTTQIQVEVEDDWMYDDLDLGSNFLPAHVVGRFSSEAEIPDGSGVVVAANGTVAATTTTFSLAARKSLFAALLPEKSFRAGHNRIEVLLASEDGSLTLVPRRAVGTYILDDAAGALTNSNGRRFEIRPGAVPRGRKFT